MQQCLGISAYCSTKVHLAGGNLLVDGRSLLICLSRRRITATIVLLSYSLTQRHLRATKCKKCQCMQQYYGLVHPVFT